MRHNSHACAGLVHALQCRLRAWHPITFLGNAYSVDDSCMGTKIRLLLSSVADTYGLYMNEK